MRTFEEIKNTIETGLGKHDCDLKLANVSLVNVYSNECYETDIYIKNKRIVSIEPGIDLKAKRVIDCRGKYAVPGLIDTHMHFETTMLSPEALTTLVVPKGTTTLCADLMEIANVAGEDGLRTMLESVDKLPCRMILEVPSRVPTAPGLETTGAVLGPDEVRRIMEWDESISLGELDPSKILFVKDEYIQKVAETLAKRKIVNGHAIGRKGQELNVYASSGICDDHECVDFTEMLDRIRLGMFVLVREGSTERNLDTLIGGAVESGMSTENLCFCTDDKHPNEINEEGHINYNVRRAIELGLKPMDAIKIATINAAKHFRLEDEIGSITPGRLADILLVSDLNAMEPETVLFEGEIVAENGALLREPSIPDYPAWILDTVHLKKPVTADSFAVFSDREGKTLVNVIEMIPRQIINTWGKAELAVENGRILRDVEKDILKLAVVERYGKTGNVGVGFIKGFQLKNGALAFSTSHDHHNIVCIGTNDEDMAVAVNELNRIHGGCSVAMDGKVVDSMPLPIGGLISNQPAGIVMEEIERMNRSAESIGCVLPAPFMALSFISLPTVPELGLTDMGLVDVLKHKLIPVEA